MQPRSPDPACLSDCDKYRKNFSSGAVHFGISSLHHLCILEYHLSVTLLGRYSVCLVDLSSTLTSTARTLVAALRVLEYYLFFTLLQKYSVCLLDLLPLFDCDKYRKNFSSGAVHFGISSLGLLQKYSVCLVDLLPLFDCNKYRKNFSSGAVHSGISSLRHFATKLMSWGHVV